ncbi:hypothetical protein B0H14DRAFT_3426228 [Mycena olivaceomarginata]|nr:hypothetical protein B0H14DRAFT_3426228 [Mycena olivaceomarginata]
MRATVSIYEDPAPKSEADVWTDEESKKTFYVVLAVSFAAVSTMVYVGYQLFGRGIPLNSDHGLLSKLPRYPPVFV